MFLIPCLNLFSRRVRIASLVAIALAVATNAACPQRTIAKLADEYAHSLKAVHDAADTEHAAGRVSDAEYRAVLAKLLQANELGLKLNDAVKASTSNTAAIQAIVAEAQAAINDGSAGVSNPQSKQALNLAAQATLTLLNSILAATATK